MPLKTGYFYISAGCFFPKMLAIREKLAAGFDSIRTPSDAILVQRGASFPESKSNVLSTARCLVIGFQCTTVICVAVEPYFSVSADSSEFSKVSTNSSQKRLSN